MSINKIVIVGGDRRTECMGTILKEKGCNVVDSISQADIVIGGIPLVKDKKLFTENPLYQISIEELVNCLRPGMRLFAGVIPTEVEALCKEKKVLCHDFMKQESIAIFNAIATAEGCILEALKNQETNIHHSESLVLGYGRCGKVLAHKLMGLSANVTIASQNEEELASANALGGAVLPLDKLEEKMGAYEYIYNTIPASVLTESVLTKVRDKALIIDIASGQGGVDYNAAKNLGIHAIHCLGLPGKYAAKASAQKLTEYVMRMF